MKKTIFNSLFIFILWLYPAFAAEPLTPINFKGTYQFTLAGIPFGKAEIEFSQSAKAYKARSDVMSTGLARIFVQHDSATTSEGSGADYHYGTVAYESNYQTRKKKKYVKMRWLKGVIAEEIVTPPDNRASRPAVAAALKNDGVDPLAFGLIMRTEAAKAIAENREHFSINYYDGRRLMQVDFTVAGDKLVRIAGKKYAATLLFARRKPIAGFTQNELDDFAPGEPSLLIYMSKDERFVPIKLELPLSFGTATATLMPNA